MRQFIFLTTLALLLVTIVAACGEQQQDTKPETTLEEFAEWCDDECHYEHNTRSKVVYVNTKEEMVCKCESRSLNSTDDYYYEDNYEKESTTE